MRSSNFGAQRAGTPLDGDDWTRQWNTFEKSAFRLETLPQYNVESERGLLEKFLAGEPMPADYNSGWHNRIRRYRSLGKTVRRVRLVAVPLTDYQRRQFAWAYPGNFAAGEEIRILNPGDPVASSLPAEDFWLFDDRSVALLRYEDGVQIGRELLTGAVVRDYVEYRKRAVEHSVPFDQYVKSLSG